jgi:hypothetical protein|uniref:YubB ferredoxin-like domain-containing protein n=1 Tax=Mimiviridae sp. ChoanoV1 TaxID=2596887 RepID=A0A5B8IGL2_9VIRU|nr:hypothetical protein 6_19 [Mimiviridae sp. ChoanoV1]
MPIWYSGTVKIIGNTKPFHEWKEKKDYSNFADTFIKVNNIGERYTKWGVKWDLARVDFVETGDYNIFSFSFDTAWGSPIYLWKNIEEKYSVMIIEYGFEEQQVEFYKYLNGYTVKFDYYDWMKEKFNYQSNIEDEEEEEDNFIEWRNNIFMDVLNEWNKTSGNFIDTNWEKVVLP